MLCYHCEKAGQCSIYQALDVMSKDFNIKDCRDYNQTSAYKYRLIAQNDDLMALIYDYFTDSLVLSRPMTDEEIRRIIKTALLNM